jgi:hypothetical protein
MGKTHVITIFIFSPVATFENAGGKGTALPEQSLAMKLCAWREYLDISDARRLL